MCREVLSCTLICVLCLDLVSSAPITASSSQKHSKDNKLSIYFRDAADSNGIIANDLSQRSLLENNDLTDDEDFEQFMSELGTSIDHHRSKRHAIAHDVTRDEVDIDDLLSEDQVSPSVQRHRRSAVFMLHAAMKLCEREVNRLFCGTVELVDRDIRLSVKFADQ